MAYDTFAKIMMNWQAQLDATIADVQLHGAGFIRVTLNGPQHIPFEKIKLDAETLDASDLHL